jgi:hypothetical protein
MIVASCIQGSPINEETTARISKTDKVPQKGATNVIRFKVNKRDVVTSGWAISRFTWNDDPSHRRLNITSNMHDEKRTIKVNLDGAVRGEYFFGEPGRPEKQSYGSFFPDYAGDRTNSFSFFKGSFRIIEIDTARRRINGNFSGIVKNPTGETLEITDGEIINGELTPGIRRY